MDSADGSRIPEAKQVKAHEEQALQLLGGISDLSNLDNVDKVS